MRQKYLVILLFSVLVLSQFAFATELKVTKVSDLKAGDIIIDKNGNEIVIGNITKQEKQSLTISEYLRQKVYGNISNQESESSDNIIKVVGSGSSGSGILTGNVVVAPTQYSKNEVGVLTKLILKIKGWFN